MEFKITKFTGAYGIEKLALFSKEIDAVWCTASSTVTGKGSKKHTDRIAAAARAYLENEVSDADYNLPENDQMEFDFEAAAIQEAAAAIQEDKKIQVIRSQKAYCLENAKKAREDSNNEAAARDWESMACAYEISLQILTEEGDWMPEEKEELILAEITADIQGMCASVAKAMHDASWNARTLHGWDYISDRRLTLRAKAYEAYLEGMDAL